MSIYVCLGPSASLDEARAVLDATYLPPAAMGDVYDLVRRGARAIVILDGFFERVPAVWHKEVLYALSNGVRVFGGASMGALRASELWSFGMEGVGRIFEDFRDGVLEDDDEVTVVHAPAESGYRPLSEAMVNLRDGLRRACDAHAIAPATRELLASAAKKRHYPERSWEATFEDGLALGVPRAEIDALRAFVRREKPNLKRDDALAVLRRVADAQREGLAPHAPTFVFERTSLWDRMTATETRFAAPRTRGEVDAEAIARHLSLLAPDRREIVRSALLLRLVALDAARIGLQIEPEERASMRRRFLSRHGLDAPEQLEAWLADNALSPRELDAIVDLECVTDQLVEMHYTTMPTLTVTELQRQGLLPEVTRAVAARDAFLRARGIDTPTLADAGIDEAALLRWYQEHIAAIEAETLEDHAKELGFATVFRFVETLLREYLYATREPPGEER